MFFESLVSARFLQVDVCYKGFANFTCGYCKFNRVNVASCMSVHNQYNYETSHHGVKGGFVSSGIIAQPLFDWDVCLCLQSNCHKVDLPRAERSRVILCEEYYGMSTPETLISLLSAI